MRVVSVNVGQPREVPWKGRKLTTAIFKEPVDGPVAVRRLDLDGDRQADPRVHGGADMAVYAYRAEHYAAWRRELGGRELPWGTFGENLTVAGLPPETEARIGDRLRAGSALVRVTAPRIPCYKLGMRLGQDRFVPRFLASGRTGCYLAVEQEGEVQAGDPVTLVERAGHDVTVAEVVHLYADAHADAAALRLAAELEALPASWREYFAERLAKAPAPDPDAAGRRTTAASG
jgi:MOSC domain-containing protein YiiM